ncbi:hypothetical protein HZA33_00735 [Candidatus Pacearchaeota archaeon]|nr:hypothetical protein [Candidatus Pacearchaeota archaeon]
MANKDAENDINEQLNNQFKIAQELQQQLAMLENIAKQYMTKEAISRYGNLKIAHQETAVKAIAFIAQAIQLGQIREKIDDKMLKEILKEIREKKEFRIKK